MFRHEIREPIAALQAALDASSSARNEPKGELRIACPQLFGRAFLPSVLADYREHYPDVQLSVRLVDAVRPPTWEGLDVLVHVGALPDSTARSTVLGTARNRCYAAPSFLAQHGDLKDPVDLTALPCITYSREAATNAWRLRNGRARQEVVVRPSVRVNDAELALALVRRGVGIAQLPVFLSTLHVEDGTLIEVLKPWHVEIGPITALTRPGRRRPVKAVRFLEHLRAALHEVGI